jgi:hypothetical protein
MNQIILIFSRVRQYIGEQLVLKGIASQDWKNLQMASLDRFEVQ